MWRSSARMVLDKPWTGVGAGAWEVEVPRYQGANSSVEVDYYAHNDLLQLVAEYGLPLGIGWIAVLMAYVLLSMRSSVYRGMLDPQLAIARGLACCSLITALTVSAAGFPFHLAGVVCLTMVALGMLAATQSEPDSSLGPTAKILRLGNRSALALRCLFSLLLALTTYITLLAGRAEYALVKAVNLGNTYLKNPAADRKDMAQAAALLREGLAINPHYRKIGSPAADALVAFGDLPSAAAALSAIAQSRPHVPDIWANLVMIHANLRQNPQAELAMKELERLQPAASRTLQLRILLLYRNGANEEALGKLTQAMDRGDAEIEMFNFAYAMGLETHNSDFALHALSMRSTRWPVTAADGHFKSGMIYASLPGNYQSKAREAFELGYRAAPPAEREAFRQATPQAYKQYLQ